MPELPEVETTRLGIEPHVRQQKVRRVTVREPRLRWPVPPKLARALTGQTITAVARRGKYLLFESAAGTALLHLGMSGSLRIVDSGAERKKHDHIDIEFANGCCLRFHDPRRFGSLLWIEGRPEDHPLLAHLGPEPLGNQFDGGLLRRLSRGRRAAIKNFIMDGKVVVGVGNIYASEALYLAGIDPRRAAHRVSLARYENLATAIRQVLNAAIQQGGTTLRDFVSGHGEPGYFGQSLNVYERIGEACHHCGSAIRMVRLGQRSTYFCPRCQT